MSFTYRQAVEKAIEACTDPKLQKDKSAFISRLYNLYTKTAEADKGKFHGLFADDYERINNSEEAPDYDALLRSFQDALETEKKVRPSPQDRRAKQEELRAIVKKRNAGRQNYTKPTPPTGSQPPKRYDKLEREKGLEKPGDYDNIVAIIDNVRAASSWTGIRPGRRFHMAESQRQMLVDKQLDASMISFAEAATEEPVEPRPIGWGNMVGLELLRQRLTLSLTLPQTSPALFKGDTPLRVNRNFVLWGPPGTGKTVIARRAAQIAGAYFIAVKGFQLLSGFNNEPGPRIDAMYGVAASIGRPVVIFVDEAENVIRDRTKLGGSDLGQMTQACVQAFLTNIEEGQLDAPVYTIFATNDASEIDPAIMSRVGDSGTIPVWLPSESDRRARLTMELSKMKNIVDKGLLAADGQLDAAFVDDVVRLTQWSSNRDITKALQQIYAMPLARKMKAIGEGDPFSVRLKSWSDIPKITRDDFYNVLGKAPLMSKTTAIQLYTWGAKTYGRAFMADFVPAEFRIMSKTDQKKDE